MSSLYKSLRSAPLQISPAELLLLQKMYPLVDWDSVDFRDSMPWFMLKSFAIGTALPHNYNSGRVCIHIRNYKELTHYERLCLLVHEAFHVQQYQELQSMGKQWSGWGWNRRFMRYYMGWYLQGLFKRIFRQRQKFSSASYQAYISHPMEVPAYVQEHRLVKVMHELRWNRIEYFLAKYPDLVCNVQRSYKRPSPFFWLFGGLIALLVSLLVPVLSWLFWPFAWLLRNRSL